MKIASLKFHLTQVLEIILNPLCAGGGNGKGLVV